MGAGNERVLENTGASTRDAAERLGRRPFLLRRVPAAAMNGTEYARTV